MVGKYMVSGTFEGTLDLYKDEVFKLYMSDTGLLVSMLDDAAQTDLRANRNFGVYKGALHENIVAEAFTKAGLEHFYWKAARRQCEL